jgi:hypothetical protein
MRLGFAVVLVGTLALSTGCSAARDGSPAQAYTPTAADCGPASAGQRSVLATPDWQKFGDAVRVCAVHAGTQRPQLFIASVWADVWYAAQPNGAETQAMPLPLLLGPGGERLGELPANFPTDPPAQLELRFLNWKAGLPNEIRLCVRSPTAAGDQPLSPLTYRSGLGRYEPAGPAPNASLKDDCHGRR